MRTAAASQTKAASGFDAFGRPTAIDPSPGSITYVSPRSAPLADRGEQQMGPCQGRRNDVVIGGRCRKPRTGREQLVAGRGRRTARGAPAQFIQRCFVGGVLKHPQRSGGGVILVAP